jgi:hypothetical protein
MIWLAWRQHRAEALLIGLALALFAAFLLTTGLAMAGASQQLGLGACLTRAAATGDRGPCDGVVTVFENQFGFLYSLTFYLSILPALLGMLVGGPLVARELEQRTHLLAWTQSITRWRWATVQLALVLGMGVLASGALLALLIWWYAPFAQLAGRFSPSAFDIQGPVWVAAAVLALAVGIVAGALTRRTVLAILIAFVLFLGIRIAVESYLRPTYEPAITVTSPLDARLPTTSSVDDWTLSRGWLDAHGNPVNQIRCVGEYKIFQQCLQADGVTAQYISYQPADRFWPFQWIETGIYLAISVPALALTVYLVRRRLV